MRIHPVAWILWATGAGIVAFTTTNPIYLGLLVAVAWFVYAARRIDGPTSRSFRTFAVAGAVALVLRTALSASVVPSRRAGSPTARWRARGSPRCSSSSARSTRSRTRSGSSGWRLAGSTSPRWRPPWRCRSRPAPWSIARRVREGQRLRGIEVARWRALPALAVPVLETGMEEAATLAESMDARGHGRGRRSRYRDEPWSAEAVLMTCAATLAAATFAVAAWSGWAACTRPRRRSNGPRPTPRSLSRSCSWPSRASARRAEPPPDPKPSRRLPVSGADDARVCSTSPFGSRTPTDRRSTASRWRWTKERSRSSPGRPARASPPAQGLQRAGAAFHRRHVLRGVLAAGRDTVVAAAPPARERGRVRPAGSRRVVRARPGGGRARLRHGEPGGPPTAHAPAGRGDARPARHRAASRPERERCRGASASASRSGRRSRRVRASWFWTSRPASWIRRPPST